MFSASQLTDEQKAALKQRAADGASIADLQNHLKEAFGIGITYMDARFMVLDLGIEILEEEEEEKPAEEAKEEIPEEAAAPTGGVSVSLDQITRPGALISGRVTFSDGESAVWMLDQYGRPGLDPDTEGYRPSEDDIKVFQKNLSELVRKQGY